MIDKQTDGTAIFVGTSDYAVPSLKALDKVMPVSAVITNNQTNAVAQAASNIGVQVFAPRKIQDIEDNIIKLAPTVMVVGHYGQIIPRRILDIPHKGSVNIHPSLLPRHRGPAPVPHTILAGDELAGTTLIQMDEKMDHGPIFAQTSIPLRGDEYADDLLKKLWDVSADLLSEYLPKYLTHPDTLLVPQDESRATTHGYMHRGDGELRADMTIEDVWRKHRAYRPWPGTWLSLSRGKKIKRIKFLQLKKTDAFINTAPGTFYWNGDLYITFADGAFKVDALQVEGGKPLSGKEFFNGYIDLLTRE